MAKASLIASQNLELFGLLIAMDHYHFLMDKLLVIIITQPKFIQQLQLVNWELKNQQKILVFGQLVCRQEQFLEIKPFIIIDDLIHFSFFLLELTF
jgi:hypothetical protein